MSTMPEATSISALPQPALFNDSSVMAHMSYVQPSAIRPCSYTFEPPPGEPWENAIYDDREICIHDARLASTEPALEREGFELWDVPTVMRDFRDVDEVRSVYYQEARELALAVTGARRAYVFDHLLRQREPSHIALSFGKRVKGSMAAANGRIHNDYTDISGQKRLAMVIPALDELIEVRRYSIINIWRPVHGTVLDTPLALCDARTVSAHELIACDVKYPHRTGEIYLASHADSHRWSYFSQMEKHEALIFKQYDSQFSGTSRFTLHAAFDLPYIPANTPARTSIELRCLVTY
ncbi:CmcJ/NvfI family oxidoreductase [Undibacterium sp. TS12]|uniref:CmcJ/NvfI family oxidoreductase n=1 Tax=Undibacterium sp. TS12 TaxID=2908202 RepID=UPI001F4C5352|nr:CmcJ/NvfI family oxidoreductase [Undibacterium sp. TS12]MCH8617882.1 methyltransferase [Undibacterium sp. TS12]